MIRLDRRFWAHVCIVTGILLATSRTVCAQSHELRIGGLFDLTGGGAIWGKSEKNAFLLACSDFEKSHPSFHITPLIEDTLFSNRNTVTSLQKLIAFNKVSYIIGATWENTVPMMPLCEQKKVVCISPSYHGKEYYNRSWQYNFTAWFDDRGYSSTIAAEVNRKGIKRVALFAALTPYYDSLVDDLLNQLSSSIVSTERVTLEERDFKSILLRVNQDVDGIVMLLDNAGQIQAFLKQWSEFRGDRPPVFSDDLIAYLDPPDNILRHGFPILYATPILDGTLYDEFAQRYTASFKEAPTGSSAAVTYDETLLLLSCASKHSTTSGVRECLSATNSYPGASGMISFNGGQTRRERVMRIAQLASTK